MATTNGDIQNDVRVLQGQMARVQIDISDLKRDVLGKHDMEQLIRETMQAVQQEGDAARYRQMRALAWKVTVTFAASVASAPFLYKLFENLS